MKTFFLFLILAGSTVIFGQCNGHPALCDQAYDDITFLTTHNAYNSGEDGFSFPNQNNNITQQLEDGIRSFMLDIYDVGGVLTVYHGEAVLGTMSLIDILNDIKTFMDDNPREVLTLIFETYATSTALEMDLAAAGLTSALFVKETGEEWPTLQEMIDSEQRLVIFSEVDNGLPGQDWYHYFWEHTVETHYSWANVDDFNCDYNRGEAANDLFLINHFITNPDFGVADPDQAAIANASPLFMDRVLECETVHDRRANFVAVDFYEVGSCMEVVNELNGTEDLSIGGSNAENVAFSFYPNPATESITIFSKKSIESLRLVNLTGEVIYVWEMNPSSNSVELNLSGFAKGVYLLEVNDQREKLLLK